MQQTGTLRRRRRRNLAKVNGLSQIPYNEDDDYFNGMNLFGSGGVTSQNLSTRLVQGTEVCVTVDELLAHPRKSISAFEMSGRGNFRITRDPTFHLPDDDLDIEAKGNNKPVDAPFLDLGPLHKRQHVDDSLRGRAHFLDKFTMQRLKQLIWLGVASGALPWKWNEKEYKIEKWRGLMGKIWWFQWFLFTIQTFWMFGFHMFTFHRNAITATSYRGVFQGCFALLRYSYVILLNVNLYYHREQMRKYINNLFNFNQSYVEKYLIHLEDYKDGGRAVINCAVLVNFLQVVVSVSLFLVMPYQPWYMFSYIYPRPWYWLIPGAIQEFMVVGQVLTSYMLVSWMAVAHNNSLKFWLMEIHNMNDSDYTSDDLRTAKTAFETYKAIQVLGQLFNDCVAPMGIPMVKVIVLTAMVPCGYVLIRSMNNKFIEEFPGILVYPLAVLDCTCAGFVVMSMSAEVFDLGCSFIDSWSRTKSKDFRRILMSCPTIKVWVGRMYFITVSTTITFFKVIFGYITDCIITFK